MAPMEKLIGLLLWICLFSTAYCQYKPNFSRSYLRREIFILNLEDGYFGCQVNASTDFLQLFELSKLCDGVPQCYLGSDELSSELKCTDRNFCHPKMPRCVNGVCLDNLCYCNDGFGGKGCDLPDENECKYRPCDVFAHCTNTMGSYYCSCFPGYEGDGFTCHDINECEIPELAALCVANAECCNLPGHYVCKCREGYTGNATVACTDVNECSDPQCCGRGATCENVPGSYRCFCPAGFSGNPLEECFDVDECLYNPCGQGALCSNTAGGYVCTCPPGYTGAPTPEAGCVDINECLEPHLYCGSLANCINTQGSFYCECPPGYTGNPKLGCTDINECPHSCGANTDCSNTPGSYVCRCKPGYSGDPYLSSGCTDENECLRPGACGQNAECYNQPGSYECLCKHGYTGNPRQFCSDVNECLQNPCAQYASCENLEGSYQCQCLEGYRGDPDTVCTRAMVKVQCRGNYECTSNAECVNSYCRCKSGFQEVGTECIDVDECSTRNVCGPNARCINSVGTYRCECKKGYEKVRKTLQSPCRDTNECLFGPFPCGKNAKCMNTDGSYECVCPDNLLGDPREACRSPCEGVDCGPHATCEVSGKEAACICDLGFTYDPANIAAGCGDVNECDVIHGPSGLCGQGAVCTNVPGSYHCFCQPGFTGDPFRHCEDINECDRRFGPAGKCAENAICTNTMGSFHCTCPPGYTGNGRYQCQDINECSQSYGPNGKCGISAICTNTPGSFHCRCPPGTQGDPFVRCLAIHACNRDSDCRGNAVCRNGQCLCPAPNYGDDCRHPCDNVFCGDYAKCRLDRNGKAICMCLPGYTGQTNSLPGCRDIDECAQNPCATNAVCRNTPGSYECTCPSQFKGDGYRSCVSEVPTRPLVDCSVEPCRPNEDCIQTPNGRQCVCKRGYIVDSVSKRCRDINECTEYNSQKPPCGSEAFCSNLEGSYVCHCPSNYVGNPYIACYPDGGTCQRDSECPGNTICLREGFAKPHCGCKHPFVRDGAYCILESITCSPTSKCPTNQECILTGSNYGICICPKGYTIEANRFCRDINECEEMKDASLCGVNAKCVNLPGSYDCVCDAGYTGNAREGCKLISYQCQTDDDCPTNQRCNLGACKCFPPYVFQDGVCKHPCDWKQCGQYASCVLVGSEPQCQCNEGFTGNPNTGCWDIDECMLGFPLDPNGPCGSGAICVNTVGSCKCQCPPGTTGDPYKTGCVGSPGCSRNSDCPATTTCETISGLCIDPCMTSICGPNAYCMPQNHHASCVCNVGYTGDPNNLIAGCESPCKNVWCAVNAQCIVNSQNEAICVCMEGFVGNPWAGGGCYPDTGCSQARPCPQNQQCRNGICVEHCKDVDCGIGARCDKKTGQCSCLPFFIGIPEVFCVPPLLPPICIPGCGINAHCTYSVPNKCVCNVGSSGNPYQMCVTSPMPRCDSIRCGSNANCVDGLQRSDCVCPPGLQGNPFLQCDDINECLDHNRCGLNAICINTVGSYTCRCPDQMSGNPFLACTAIPTIPGSGGEFPPVIPTVPGGSTGGGGTSGGETTGSLAPTEPPRLTQCNARIVCPPNYICVDGFCRGSLGCNNVTCGQNARCEDSDQSSQCVCLPGYSGNPYDLSVGCSSPCDSIQCGPNAACEVINQRPQCQCKPGFNGDPDDLDNGCPHQSCLHDEDCPAESACYPGYGGQLQCSAPCDGHRCGPNAHCIALSRRPVCTCRTGFYGDASDLTYGCQPYFEACTANSDCAANQVCVPDENRIRNCSDVCKNVRCGHNAHCVGKDHQASCECLPGYERDLVNGGQCYPKQQPACYSDSNCSGDKVCRKTESGSIDCISVCLNYRCGTGAQCVGKNHQPVCKCLPGHAGDPRVHCEKNQCEGNIDCPDNAVCRTNPQGVKECINACEEISCGQNSRCRAFEHIGRCQCLPGFKGNGHDLVIGCVPEDRCNSDSQCKDTEVCYPNQEGVKECQDVCSYTLCGPNSDCIGSNHIAICKCISGYAGNAYSQEVGCLPIPLDKCTHDSDCPSNAVCKATRSGEPKDCINGCDEVRCGPNSKCLTLNHQARCVCVKGFVGDPNDLAQGCQIPHECSEDRNCAHDSVCRPDVDGIRKCALVCLYTQCGVEAYCIGRDHKAECLCRDGYKGNPYDKIKGCEVEFPDKCKHDDECLPSQVCRHSLSSRVLDCINVCDFVQCGPNARCLAENHYGRCECLPGYSGEPDNIINGCRHEPDDECRQNTDCASETQVCKADNSGTRKCVDACQYETCTKPHMKCVAQHHQARCVCEEGYVRDHNDISSCIPIVPDGCTNDSACATYEMCKNGPLGAKKCESPCIDFTCSPNSQCIAIHHKGQCECMEGFIGDPNSRDGCIPLPRHECNADSDCPAHNHVCRLDGDDVRRCIDACLEVHCGPNAICAVVNHVAQCQCPHGLYIGDPSDINKGCQKVECLNDDHCPSNRACADEHYCYDPCINSCGVNAVCIVQNHKAVCRCSADYTGDPYKVGCSLIDPCKTNPCHPSASCIASSGAFTCHCPPSFVGDPYGEGCRHPNSCPRGDEDCADNSACLPDASGINMCKNPCDQTSCGPNAVCQVTNHKASCICQSFFRSYDDDDPIKGCVRIPVNCTADRGCSSNQVCVKNQCRIFCSRDSECAVREKCLNGICVVPCFQHNNCQPGEACILEGYCQIGCRDNNDCDPMMRCIQNRCQNPCDIPKVCGQNALCLVSNHEAQCECIPGFRGTPSATIECQREPLLCSSILPCPPGFKCIGGRCRAPCSECALGEQCVNAACMSQCTSDSNCPTGEICINQICQPGCRTDSDCRLNELCAANQCKCRLGFVMSQSGCEDLNECDEKPCHERAICENVPGSFFCRCREGEIGDGYTHCQEPGECPNGDIDCPPNAACGMDYKNVTKCINPCDEGPCGPQAECTVIEHRSQCACPKIGLFTGKPYDKNIGCISVECLKDSDCPDQKQCINFACQDPCDNVQCEPNGICKVRNHQPYCECNIGYQNNGRLSCVDIDECQQHKCHSTAICENVPGSYACTCPPGLIEKPQGPPGCYDPNVCFNGNKDCPSTATCIQVKGGIPFCKDPCEDPTICGYNAKCHTINHEPVCSCPPNYTGDAKQRCIPVECVEDNNCKSNEVCKDNKCVDACLPPISCGENTLCVAKEHRFTCRCRDSFFGNPELGCRRIFQCTQDVECRAGEMCRDATCFVQCNSNRDCGSNERCHTGRCYLQCRSDGDCPPDFSCSAALCIPNMKDRCLNDEECADSSTCRVTERGLRDCIDPCENHLCGRNAECIARGHTAVCECKQGFVGNPLDEVEGCVKVECYDHNDCNSDRRCNNYKCVDPCQLQNICGSNAFCSAEDHAAVCRCRNGYEGDPLAGCRPIDYCARNPCHPSGICQNTPTGYECYCPPDRNLGNAYTDPGCWAEGECPNGNSDCPLTAVCELDITLKRFLCKDPCQRPNVCGLNAKCRVEDRQPVCYCPESFTGDPRDRVRGCVRVPPICSADPDCPAGLVCEKRRCRPPCQTDADCAQRELCIQGHCVQGCRQDQDCLAGEICVSRNCIPGCRNDNECLNTESCIQNSCKNPCESPTACGANALCEVVNHRQKCECPHFFRGNPTVFCNRDIQACLKTSSCPSNHFCQNGYCRVGCTSDTDCAVGEKCFNEYCVVLCRSDGDCQHNEICISNRCQAGCRTPNQCSDELTCIRNECINPCESSAICGTNAECKVIDHRASCTCPAGFVGRPNANVECIRVSQLCGTASSGQCPSGYLCVKGRCRVTCSSERDCAVNEKCSNGVCHIQCYRDRECAAGEICQQNMCIVGCRSDNECPYDEACIGNQCLNPCGSSTRCGTNAACEVINHQRNCTCPPGLFGDGNSQCWRVSRKCVTQDDCGVGQVCEATRCRVTCSSDNECFDNEKCVDRRCNIICTQDSGCPDGFVCDNGQCLPGCRSDAECPLDKYCINKQCLDPCASPTACGTNAKCLSANHQAYCSCPPDYTGNAKIECRKMECVVDIDCGPGKICQSFRCIEGCRNDQTCPADQSCISRKCVNPCHFTGACGINALCQTISHQTRCSCPSEFTGDPLKECYRMDPDACARDNDCTGGRVCSQGRCKITEECRSDDECPPGHICEGRNCFVGCRNDDNCPFDQACISRRCESPCNIRDVCGINAQCTAFGHQAHCSCPVGFFGNPREECSQLSQCQTDKDCNIKEKCQNQKCIEFHGCASDNDCNRHEICTNNNCQVGCRSNSDCDYSNACINNLCQSPCQPGACGINAECREVNHEASCRCLPDYVGDPKTQCVLDPDICYADTGCKVGHICVSNRCVPGCRTDANCPYEKACVDRRCIDPCSKRYACGIDALCKPQNHQAECVCPPSYGGDPRVQCLPAPPTPLCYHDDDCKAGETCINFACLVKEGCTSDAACPGGHICEQRNCIVGCRRDADCTYDKACINSRCINPCSIQNACGFRAICTPVVHRPQCSCPSGLDGNPYHSCTKVMVRPPLYNCTIDRDCSPGHICRDHVCISGCVSDDHCSPDQMCRNHRCINPCELEGACGINADCSPYNHRPQCTCPSGFSGNPNIHCTLGPDKCIRDEDCGIRMICDKERCIDGCRTDDKCPLTEVCYRRHCQNPCSIPKSCGHNAICRPTNHQPICSCPPTLTGNPKEYCGPGSLVLPCQRDEECTFGQICEQGSCVEGCRRDEHCTPDMVCRNKKCRDPCSVPGVCGRNALCVPITHQAICTCRAGFIGDPRVECITDDGMGRECETDKDCPVKHICENHNCEIGCRNDDHCSFDEGCINRICQNPCTVYGRCGLNALCRPVQHKPECTCPHGYKGNPNTVCHLDGMVECSRDSDCDLGTICENHHCVARCRHDNNCPLNRACVNGQCKNPCLLNSCGRNTFCQPSNHQAICSCFPGYRGNPREGCEVPPGGCKEDADCAISNICENNRCVSGCRNYANCPFTEACINRQCQNPCDIYGACGQNAICKAINHDRECTCPPEYTGNPMFYCHRIPLPPECTTNRECPGGHICQNRRCIDGCQSNDDCPLDQACNRGQCINPCLLSGACGINAICTPAKHQRHCTCLQGYAGDPNVHCTKIGIGSCRHDSECGAGRICVASHCVVGCRAHEECPNNQACVNQLCQNPCTIGGICGVNAQCQAIDHQAVCSCLPMYSGDPAKQCTQVIPECEFNTDCGSGYVCVNNKCSDIDECLQGLGPCGRGAICTNLPGSYKCSCPTDFAGDPYGHGCVPSEPHCYSDDRCKDTEACNLLTGDCYEVCDRPGICGKGARCRARHNRHECYCPDGYAGDPYRECSYGARCNAHSDCPGNLMCLGEHCGCPHPFHQIHYYCILESHNCTTTNPCPENEECVPIDGYGICICPRGFALMANGVCKDMNECEQRPFPCGSRAQCYNTVGSFTCRCPPDTIGDPYRGCEEVPLPFDECRSDGECPHDRACDRSSKRCFDPCPGGRCCAQHATYEMINHQPVCRCLPGYEGNPTEYCYRIKDCRSDYSCPGNLLCLPNGHCGCPAELNRKLDFCIISTSFNCSTNNPCPENQQCIYTGSSIGFCICPRGYRISRGLCIEINECQERDWQPCGTNAICTNIPGSYRCHCPEGSSGDPYKGHCEVIQKPQCKIDSDCPFHLACDISTGQCKDLCRAYTCGRNAVCTMVNHEVVCSCPAGYTGDPHSLCYLDLTCGRHYRCPGNMKCLESNTCGCRPQDHQVGEYCISHEFHNCTTNNPCPVQNELCVYTGPQEGFCVCPHGYEMMHTGLCRDIDECRLSYHPCAPGAKCKNFNGGYNCYCPAGTIGDPYIRGCVEIGDRCTHHENCSHIMECDFKTSQCISPCHKCGPGATCTVSSHVARCTCESPKMGDPEDKSMGCIEQPSLEPRTVEPPKELQVMCLADGVQVSVLLGNGFNGVIYVKGYSQDPQCRRIVSSNERETLDFKVLFSTCGLIHVNGEASFILVIQKHPKLVTNQASAYHVKCLYNTGEKTITLGFNVSMITTSGTIANTGPPPTCQMTICTVDGREVGSAEIGDDLLLKVDVQPDYIYGGYARSCVAKTMEDDGEYQYEVTDEDGCATEPNIFGNWEYDPHKKTLTARFNAFKFPSSNNLRFQCNIRVCFGSCPPVNCDGVDAYGRRKKRQAQNTDLALGENFQEGTLREEIMVQSNAILTFDRKESQVAKPTEGPKIEDVDNVCLPKLGLIISLIITTLLALVAVAVAISCWLMAYRRRPKTEGPLPHPPDFPNPLYTTPEPVAEPSPDYYQSSHDRM